MFTVGEFARLAQVSKRLLRYYDEIGLLRPVHTDRFTGYRYYSAEQLPDLNRILALKDLGLSLEQIQQARRENLSSDALQGMLLLKKSEIEQQVQEEMLRIRNIETRLQLIRTTETGQTLDVVVKQIDPQPALSIHLQDMSIETGLAIYNQLLATLPEGSAYGSFFGAWYSGGLYEQEIDIELGRFLTTRDRKPVALPAGRQLTYHELPAIPAAATYVVRGWAEGMHIGYSAIGMWAEANHYRFAGPPREIALKVARQPDFSDGVTEIQFPVEPVPAPDH